MKTKMVLLGVLLSLNAFAEKKDVGTGDAILSINPDFDNTLFLSVDGSAAKKISKQMKKNGAEFKREPFSGALVQRGKGIVCIDQHKGAPLYCSITINGKSVE